MYDLPKKCHKVFVLIAMAIITALIVFFWLFGIFDYVYFGMGALPNHTRNHKLILYEIYDTVNIPINTSDPNQNKNITLYESDNCRIIIESTTVSPEEDVLYIRLKCFGHYNLTQTTYFTPLIIDFQIGEIINDKMSILFLLKTDGPMTRNYYIIDGYIPNYSKVSEEKSMLQISGFVKHYFERTTIILK